MKKTRYYLSEGIFLLRIIIVISAAYGLFLQLYPKQWHQLTYYTLISNIIVLAFYIKLLVTQFRAKLSIPTDRKLIRLKGAVTSCILLTFLVYVILLAPIAKPEDFYNWKNYTLHYIVPIAVFFDWLLTDKRGYYHYLDPVFWTVIPLLYTIFALVKGYVFRIPIPDQEHSPYPYFFVNVDKLGWSGFAVYFFAILFFYMCLGYIMYFIKSAFLKKK